jgi:PAS domain S-box-containing protein
MVQKENFPIKLLIIYLISGAITLVFIDNFIDHSYENYIFVKHYLMNFGIIFILITSAILFTILNKTRAAVKKDKDKLIPYEFALDKSVDAVHWLTMEGKFIYANDSTCKMDGYSKEEFKNMYLEDVDPNFTRETAPQCMQEIRDTPNWRIETTHRRKNGAIYPIEVSGHGIVVDGKEYICAFARDISERMKYREKMAKLNENLQKSLGEKEILLKEIHHRVKNNMEIISSLLNMQARRAKEKNIKHILMESMSRIQTMALVHEFLYLGESLAKIDFNAYISRLLNDIKELYITQNTKLNIDLHVDKLYLSTDRCIQLGMVVHEICVNSMKYAFHENRDNLLCIHMKLNDNLVKIKIRDNGDGINNINAFCKSDSIGIQLIRTIVENQLNGTLNFINNDGLECNIEFLRKESHYE